MRKIKFISVDFQKDFTSKNGRYYAFRPSVNFVKKILIPFFILKNIKVAEIISDYRQPRPGDSGDCCHPGEWGYESEIPVSVKSTNVWIKCMNSPIWIRKNIGLANKKPGIPFQDTGAFGAWLNIVVGKPDEVEIILIGLTVDCCVLCTAQELSWRGYDVKILSEAVDTASGKFSEKNLILNNPPLTNWVKIISWKELKNRL